MNVPPRPMWGPWSPVLTDEAERLAQLRCIRTLVHVFLNSRRALDYTDTVPCLMRALQAAENGGSLVDARMLFDSLPAARQRDIIATFAVLHKPLTPQKGE